MREMEYVKHSDDYGRKNYLLLFVYIVYNHNQSRGNDDNTRSINFLASTSTMLPMMTPTTTNLHKTCVSFPMIPEVSYAIR